MHCPFTGRKTGDESSAGSQCPFSSSGIDIEQVSDNPSVEEYKKIKRVMGIITKFYIDGTDLKKGHYDDIGAEIGKIDVDIQMVNEQIKILTGEPSFDGHPKQKEYLRQLESEKESLEAKRMEFEAKQNQYQELFKWSEGIVRVCKWLELNLDDYCSKTIDYPKRENVQPPPVLDAETANIYSQGLEEITHNLQESQDFFQASIDGRLRKFHELEKTIVESQLAVVRKYPEQNERRKHIESELVADLDFVETNLNGDTSDMRRRQRMLQSHSDFLKVLKYHKDKLKALYLGGETATVAADAE